MKVGGFELGCVCKRGCLLLSRHLKLLGCCLVQTQELQPSPVARAPNAPEQHIPHVKQWFKSGGARTMAWVIAEFESKRKYFVECGAYCWLEDVYAGMRSGRENLSTLREKPHRLGLVLT
eukprot:341352-Amphidinium_carterae.1